jgi:alpha-L-rhamnosidase
MDHATPVWPEGRETEMNLLVGFRTVVDVPEPTSATLRIAAASLYRAFLHGAFLGHGPARAARGFHRADEWPVELSPGPSILAIEVVGYNVNSYYLLDQPAFLQAEVVAGGRCLAATGEAFEAAVLAWKLRRVHRYGGQRTFSEVYRLTDGFDAWRSDPAAPFGALPCAMQPRKTLLPRGVPYPEFAIHEPVGRVSAGEVERDVPVKEHWKGHFVTHIGPDRKGFHEEELEAVPMLELQETRSRRKKGEGAPRPLSLGANRFAILDFGVNRTGFLRARVTCRRPTRLFFTFDEILRDGDIEFTRNTTINLVAWDLAPGTYDLETFEPYTLRYLKLTTFEGDCDVEGVALRELAHPESGRAAFAASDRRLDTLFEAGRETFRQNALDIFMDCPSRERAGWLCDSFFTARVAPDLCGNTAVERNFIENFRLPERFEHLPDGMLPMCYPADHLGGRFIPNWAMWFVLQLEEYLARSGDREMVDALRGRVLALLDYFRPFENDDGLLESLESWVFLEWSRANDFTQDVNYPSNALYAGTLAAAARLYGRPDLADRADRVRAAVREQAFDGAFFVDNALRRSGTLTPTRNTTETCQYYLFTFDVATPETHPELWRTLVEQFGPARDPLTTFPDVHPSNAFIGNVLRLELLARHGLRRQLLDEMIGYYLWMAERTGTLWEHMDDDGSCNHGFAAHVCHAFVRDVLGLARIDPQARRIAVRFSDLPLDWCEGAVPVGDDAVTLRWERDGRTVRYRLEAPDGYEVAVDALDGLDAKRM